MSDDFILDELNNVRAQRAGRSVVGTQDANADTAARANNLSRRLGIPADVIERNMTEIEQRDRATRNSRLVREAPAPVQRYFGDPRNAAAAKDDVEPMVNMAGRYPAIGKFSPARQPEAFGDIGIVRQTGRTARETVTGIPSALASGLYSLGSQMESFIGATTDVLNAIDPKPAIAGFAGDVIAKYTGYNPRWDKSMEQTRRDLDAARVKRQAALKGEEEAWKPKSTSWIARDLLQGVSSVPATVAAMLTRDPKAASGTLGALVGAGEYDAARAQGLDIGSAIAYGARQGVVEGVTERIPASKLLGDIAARSPFGKMLMGQLVTEIPGEQVATFLQDLDEWVTLNPDKTVGEFVRERPSAAGQTLLATIGGVGTTTGGAKLATTVVDAVTKTAARRERRDIRSAAEAVEAQAGAQILDGMMSDAEAAKLRTTDPEAFRQYVEAITGGTAIETVYIPGEAIRELMQDGYRDAPFWSDHADQIDEALALDGDVALPFDQFATFVAGTPEWQTLRDDVRFSPGGMSMAELASIEEAYRADGEVASGRLAEQMEQAALAAEPGAQVYAEMRDQFQNAGFRPDAADRYASIWAANREAWAERMGMTASEYHAANPVNIRRVLPEGLAKALPVDGLDLVINAMRAPDKAERKGASLLDFISKRGGVEDRGGNIASMGGGDWHKGKVGKRKLLKDFEAAQGDMIGGATSDNSLERTIEAARDAGYDVTDEASLLTAIGNELRGTPSFANEALTESETQRIRDAGEDLRRILIESNIDPDTATKKEIEAAIDRMRDVDPFSEDPEMRELYQRQSVFFSALERAVEAVQTNRAPAAQWIATLKKTGGVKEEELEWSGVIDWLEMQTGPVEKDAVLQVVRDGGIKVDEVVLGAGEQAIEQRSQELRDAAIAERVDEETYDEPHFAEYDEARELWVVYGPLLDENFPEDGEFDTQEEAEQAAADFNADFTRDQREANRRNFEDYYSANAFRSEAEDELSTEFGDWNSDPGNDTYRELLITLPLGEGNNPKKAPSTHWRTEGVVAHTRFMDKVGPNGEKILFVEEVQSDWHQKGRDQGYETPVDPEAVDAAEQKYYAAETAERVAQDELIALGERTGIFDEDANIEGRGDRAAFAVREMRRRMGLDDVEPDVEVWAQWTKADVNLKAAGAVRNLAGRELDIAKGLITSGGVPNAPFKSTWPALVMKRVIAHAAQNGYDQVAWTTGEQQAERYSLAQTVGGINAERLEDGRYLVATDNSEAMSMVRDNGMAEVDPGSFHKGIMTAAQLKEAFGENVTAQIIEAADTNYAAWAEADGISDDLLMAELGNEVEDVEGKRARFSELNQSLGSRAVRIEGEENLRVGGEGMKAFYDRNLVNITNKLVKKYGAKVEAIPVPDPAVAVGREQVDMMRREADGWVRNAQDSQDERAAAEHYARANEFEAKVAALEEAAANPGFTITPELREAAKEGFALFQGGEQQPRGRVSGGIISGMDGPAIIELFEKSDMSTVLHETAHVWLEELKRNAASPDAPADVVEDWQAVVDWFAANNVPMEGDVIPVEAHELFARGGERYFMEGKAPSTALQRAFDTFRGWLLNIYEVVANLRSPITPEIRRVFDRMLATRDALDDASERQQLQARFESAEQAGMTQEAFAAYRALADEARTEAFNALLFRTMAGIRKERTKEYQSQAASVRDDVMAAMNKRPDFRALHLLRTGRFLDDPTRDPVKVKISRDWLVENFGEDALGLMPKGVPPIYSENGAHPDMAANLSGFRSGEEMVRALMGLEQAKRAMVEQGDKRSVREAAIKDEVDSIMFDRYGDPLSDGSIEEEALAAVANDKEAELIASENRALAKQARGQPTAYSVARQWAARKIAQGRVVDVASKAALHRYARAQAKATKAFEVALLEGNVDEAFRQSELRLLNNALISEAKKAADKVETAVSRLSRTAKQRVRKSVDQEYFDRAQALLAKFEFMPRSQKLLDEMEAFASWAEKQAADGIDVAIPPRLESDGVHYTRMSVEELVGLDESVEQLLHLGRMKKTMLDNKERREFNEIVDEAVSTIEETPQRKKNNRMRPSWIDEQKAKVASYDAALLKMEQVFDWLDNGNPNGVFNRMVFQPLAEAQARAREMTTDYLGQVRAALRALPKDVVKKWEDKVDAPELLNRETGEAFELDRQTLISMAFNVGNEGNFDKLARGYGWNPETVMRVLQRELTAEEWRFVQSMWDMIDTLWPEIEALEKRINGVAPERVEARAFTVTVGDEVIDMRGGYFPVVYDPLKNIDTEAQQAANSDNLFSKAYRRATTPKGFTKERTEVARPILLSMSVLNRHLNEVIHDITHREPIIAANKILSDRRVIKAVDDSLGRAVRQQFRPWLQHIANEWAIDARGVQGWETIAKTLRTHSTMIGMGFRLSTIFAQVAGYAGVAEKVGTRWLADGMKAALARPVETFDFVMERSKEVAARMDTMERDINSNIRDLQGRTGVLAQTRRFAFYGIGYMDRVVVIPAWLGSYNKALSEGMTDDQAIHFADKVIRQTQGAGAAKDLAAIQRGSEWLRLASMFYSYASAFYNRQRNLGRDVKRAMTEKELSEFPGLLARAWWLFAVAPIMGALPGAILSGSGPDEDEDESWMGWALGAMAGNFFYGVPLARDVASSAVSGFDYGFTPASRMVTTLMDATGDLKALVDADEETDPSKRAVKTAVESVGYVARLPLGQFSNASQFIADWAAGEADPDGVGDWLTGLQRGKLEE